MTAGRREMPAPDPSPLGAVEEALRKYGRHEEWCLKAQIGVDAKCCCGFSAALAAAARMREWAVRVWWCANTSTGWGNSPRTECPCGIHGSGCGYRWLLPALGRIRGGAEVVATREFKYPPCPHCGKAFAALIAAEVTGVTFNRLGFHLYTDTERERIESIPTKGGRAWTKVLVLPLPPDSEEVKP